ADMERGSSNAVQSNAQGRWRQHGRNENFRKCSMAQSGRFSGGQAATRDISHYSIISYIHSGATAIETRPGGPRNTSGGSTSGTTYVPRRVFTTPYFQRSSPGSEPVCRRSERETLWSPPTSVGPSYHLARLV